MTAPAFSDTIETPFGIVASDETLEGAREALRRRDLTCVLKVRGQRSERLIGLYGDRQQVLRFAKRCEGFTFCTDPKGLL